MSFDQRVDTWDTSAVTDMDGMFQHNKRFNQRVDTWDTSAVTSMLAMFNHASSFNQPMNTWDTSAVTNMNETFSGATSFDQDLSSWQVSAVRDFNDTFINATALSECNKALIYASWGSQNALFVGEYAAWGAIDADAACCPAGCVLAPSATTLHATTRRLLFASMPTCPAGCVARRTGSLG